MTMMEVPQGNPCRGNLLIRQAQTVPLWAEIASYILWHSTLVLALALVLARVFWLIRNVCIYQGNQVI